MAKVDGIQPVWPYCINAEATLGGAPSDRNSVRVFTTEAMNERPKYDLEINPKRPMLNVIQIVIDALAHFLNIFCGTTKTVDLRPTSYSGLYTMSLHIGVDLLAVVFVVLNCMRPGSDNRHIASQNIDELRKLVQAVSTQECADLCHS